MVLFLNNLVLEAPVTFYEWNNQDNNAFYESLTPQGLQALAEKGGLSTGCDMKALTPYWSTAENILEVGAGYGRVIDYLIAHGYRGTITAVERCSNSFAFLEKKYRNQTNLDLLHMDIFNLKEYYVSFDLIFILWSSIADFSEKEQPFIIQKLAMLLKKKGRVIIDTIPSNNDPLWAKKYAHKTYFVKINDYYNYIYLPDIKEIENYSEKAGFDNVTHINYITQTERNRCSYILN